MEKSKADWVVSKAEVGDEHELQQFAKDGYVDRANFLKAAEEREYELQRRARMGGKRFFDGTPREI